MAECLKCGMPYQKGAAICPHCGASLSEPVDDGLAALQQLRRLDAAKPTAQPDLEVSMPESVPDWLELLLARHGEEVPEFVGLERSRSAPPEPPAPAAPEAEPIATIPEAEAPDLLAEIETLKAKVVSAQPPETEAAGEAEPQPSPSAAGTINEPEAAAPRAAADWLAQLEATDRAAEAAPAEQMPDTAASAGLAGEGAAWQPRPQRLGMTARTSGLLAGDVLPPVSEESLDWLAELRAAHPAAPDEEVAEGEAGPVVPGKVDEAIGAEAGGTVPQPTATEEIGPEEGPVLSPSLVVEEPVAADQPGSDDQDWLSQLRQARADAESPDGEPAPMAAEPAAQTESGAASEALPDWLAELERVSATAETVEAPPAAPATPEEMPDWLRDLGVSPPSASPPATDALAASATLGPLPVPEAAPADVPEEPEIPEWLSRLVSGVPDEAVAAPQPSPTAGGGESLPAQPQAADTFETIGTADLAPDEVPDWLRELEMIQAAPVDAVPAAGWETPTTSAAPGEVEDETPPWMDDLRPLRSLAGAPPEAEPVAETSPVTKAPDDGLAPEWLAELQSLVESPPEAAPSAPTISTAPLPPGETTPDWLRDLGAGPAGGGGAGESGPVAEPGQLPDWLVKLKPAEVDAIPGVERIPPSEAASTEPLSTEEDAIESLRARLGMPRVPDVEGAALIRDIVSEPATAAAEPPPRRSIINTLIWVLIVIAILLGIAILSLAVLSRAQELLGGPAFQRFLDSPVGAGLVAGLDAYRAPLATLPDDAVVLMGIDYSPGTEAEMRPLAEMTLRDLLTRRARVVTVSLRPEGAALAHRLLLSVADRYPFGERTLNLGYLPGEIAGLRSLVTVGDLPPFATPSTPCAALATCPGWEDVRTRSEERRVGKECRSRWSPYH